MDAVELGHVEDDIAALLARMPTDREIAAMVRRRPIGLTITYICLDLGIAPGLCKGAFWYNLERTFRRYGGNLGRMYKVRFKREITFEKERDRRPDTWHIDWRDLSHATVRRALGCLFGEPPPPIVPVPS